MRTLFLFLLSIITSVCLATANASPVWKVSKGDKHLYIGGTIHLLSPKDHPLPKAFSQAYEASSHLVFETDMDALKTPAFAQKAALSMMYTDGRTLDTALSPLAFDALSQYLTKNNIPPASLMMFTPTGVMLTLTVMEYQKLGMVQDSGVDSVMHKNGKKDGKGMSFLESPDEQLRFLTNIAAGDEDQMILYTLEEIHKMPSMIKIMKSAWRQGDLEALNKEYMHGLQKDFPGVYDSLIKHRNNNWLPKIETMLHDKKEVEFVLVGALHLAGKDGVLTQLTNSGYKVAQLK